jgi:phage-related protein
MHNYAEYCIIESMKKIIWQGSSYKDLLNFPADAKRDAGYQLNKIQRGGEPNDWKPVSAIGMGVREIRIKEVSGAFRIIYVANVNDHIYVLHAFQKKTQKTSMQDIHLAQNRLKAIRGKI